MKRIKTVVMVRSFEWNYERIKLDFMEMLGVVVKDLEGG